MTFRRLTDDDFWPPRLTASSLAEWFDHAHVDEGMLRWLGFEYPDGWDRDTDPGPPIFPGITRMPGPDGEDQTVASVYMPRRPLPDEDLAFLTLVADIIRAGAQ